MFLAGCVGVVQRAEECVQAIAGAVVQARGGGNKHVFVWAWVPRCAQSLSGVRWGRCASAGAAALSNGMLSAAALVGSVQAGAMGRMG